MIGFFEKLKQEGFIKGNEVKEDIVFNSSIHQLFELAESLTDLTAVDNFVDDRSTFVYSVSQSLSGSRFPCNALECRKSRAYNLAQYSALYADRIYVRNFLSDYHSSHYEKAKTYEKVFRSAFLNDLHIFALLQPLIEDRKIVIYTNPNNICPCCLAKLLFSDITSKKFNREYKKLQNRFIDEISAEIQLIKDKYRIHLKGPDDLINHGGMIGIYESSKPSISINSLLKDRLQKNEVIQLTNKEKTESGVLDNLVSSVITDFQFDFTTSQIFKTSFLTDSKVHVDILNSITDNPSIKQRNQIIKNHLTLFVPFVEHITIKDLLTLRRREENSFILFRQALNKAIDEYKKSGNDFTEQNAKEIYEDIVAPEIARLDLKVSSAKEDLVKTTRRKALGWGGAISFGIYTGIVPTNLAVAASALGLTKVLAEYIEKTMSLSDTDESVRNENMYFLWKVSKISKSKKND